MSNNGRSALSSAASMPRQPTGHLQVKVVAGKRRYYASWRDRDGRRRTTASGPAHVHDTGRRSARGAVIGRAGDEPCPNGAFTPRMAEARLASLLEQVDRSPAPPPAGDPEPAPTFKVAVDAWLTYLEVEKRRKETKVTDARNVARYHLIPRLGADTPLFTREVQEVVVMCDGRPHVELREDRHDTFTTDDVDRHRRELLRSDLSPRTVQKILVLLHGVFKLAKRRKPISTNPSADAEQVTLEDPGTFSALEPMEFEAVYRAALGQEDPGHDEKDPDEDAIDELPADERRMYATLLATAFYAGLRLCELRDLPWRNIDFAGAMIRVESAHSRGGRSTPKGTWARSTPMVPILAQQPAALGKRPRFTGEADYVFASPVGGRVGEKTVRSVFLRGAGARGLRASPGRPRRARQPARADPRPRSPPLLVHVGGERVAADEGAGLRGPSRCQGDAAVSPNGSCPTRVSTSPVPVLAFRRVPSARRMVLRERARICGRSDPERRRPVGEDRATHLLSVDAIVEAALRRVWEEPDLLRGIAALVARCAAAFVLDLGTRHAHERAGHRTHEPPARRGAARRSEPAALGGVGVRERDAVTAAGRAAPRRVRDR